MLLFLLLYKISIINLNGIMNNKIIKLDLLGLKCPMPVLKTAKKLKEISDNDVLMVRVDDESAEQDLQELCKKKNFLLLEKSKENKILCFIIKKS